MKTDCVCKFKDGKQLSSCMEHDRRVYPETIFPNSMENFKKWLVKVNAANEDKDADLIVGQVATYDKELAGLLGANVKTYRACADYIREKLEGKSR